MNIKPLETLVGVAEPGISHDGQERRGLTVREKRKNAKIMRLENLALYGIHLHLMIVNQNGGIV